MYARTFVFAILTALVSVVAAHETNAERMARGMNPLAPRRLFNSAHVARTVPSSVSCPSNAVSGYICLRGSGGNLLGYLGNDGVTCGKSPQKFEYPSGCDVKTAIKLYGTNSYVGAYARSVVGKVITDIQNLFASLRARTTGASYTSTKIVPSILSGKTNVGGSTCQTQVFKVASKDHCITQTWKDDDKETSLVPVGCWSANKASISVQWVENPHSLASDAMSSVCPGGIEADVYLRFECSL